MNSSINILIVEDNILIADDLQMLLENIGYTVVGNVTNFDDAVLILKTKKVDFAILDIMLATIKTGIEIAQHIRDNYDIPLVFLTSNSDKATIEKAKGVKPNGYLLKPFEQEHLYSAIEIAIANFSGFSNKHKQEEAHENAIFLKKNDLLNKVYFNDIYFVKADNVYVEIFTKNNIHPYVIRSSFKNFIKKLPENIFHKVHKSYAVNINFIEGVTSKQVIVNNVEIPISKEFRKFIKGHLGI